MRGFDLVENKKYKFIWKAIVYFDIKCLCIK